MIEQETNSEASIKIWDYELIDILQKQKQRSKIIEEAERVANNFPYCGNSYLYGYIFAYGVIQGKRHERARYKNYRKKEMENNAKETR